MKPPFSALVDYALAGFAWCPTLERFVRILVRTHGGYDVELYSAWGAVPDGRLIQQYRHVPVHEQLLERLVEDSPDLASFAPGGSRDTVESRVRLVLDAQGKLLDVPFERRMIGL